MEGWAAGWAELKADNGVPDHSPQITHVSSFILFLLCC